MLMEGEHLQERWLWCVTDAGAVHAHITTAPVGVSPSIPGYLEARRLSPQFLGILWSRVRESENEREPLKASEDAVTPCPLRARRVCAMVASTYGEDGIRFAKS